MEKKLFMGAIDSSSDGLLISDPFGNVIYLNKAYFII